jgi:hypothetical protein
MEAVKTMIHDQDIPMHLWAEATRTTVYVQKILSYSALGFKTLEEMFTGKKPEVTHLKIFSCPVTSSELVDATLYKQIIGLLMYLMNTRPYICFAVNTLSQYLVEPRHVHLVAAKHVMRYLKGTLDYGLCYTEDHDFRCW